MASKTNETTDPTATYGNGTPTALANELGIDPKRLRGWLRASTFARPIEQKNSSWTITNEMADAARAKFAKKQDANESA